MSGALFLDCTCLLKFSWYTKYSWRSAIDTAPIWVALWTVPVSHVIAPNDFITSHFNCKEVCYRMKRIVNSFDEGSLACRKEITLSVRFRSQGSTCLITLHSLYARLTAIWRLLARNLWAGAKTSYFLIAASNLDPWVTRYFFKIPMKYTATNPFKA